MDMERNTVVRKVAQDVLLFVLYKQDIIDEKPLPKLTFVPEIGAEFMNNLCISVWIDSYCNRLRWSKYFCNHFKRMISSPYLFTNYVYHACDLLNKNITDAHESFFGTLSLVIHFVLYCFQAEREEFLNTCVDLFCAFFEREIRTKFEDQGGWQNFNEYLVKNYESLKKYKELIGSNQSLVEFFKELEDACHQRKEPYMVGDVVLKDVTKSQVERSVEAVGFADSLVRKMKELCKKTLKEVIADFSKTDSQVEELYRKTVEKAADTEQSSFHKDQKDPDVKASKGEQSSLLEDQEIDVKASEGEQSSMQKDREDFDVKASKGEQSSMERDREKTDMKASKGEQSSQKDLEAFRGKSNKVVPSSSRKVREKALQNDTNKTRSKKNKDKRDPVETLDLDSSKSPDFRPAPQESDQSPKLTNTERAKVLLKEIFDEVENISHLIHYICSDN